MSFLHPEFLYYMLPPLFILFGLLLTQKETQAHFFSKEVMDKLRVSANTMTLRARNALFFLIGFFIIIALGQPVIDDGKVVVKAKSADIMIALDISDSMLAEDVYPNRLELAKEKALTLLSEAPSERVGIMAFAKNSYLVSPLSFDTGAVSFLLKQLDTTSITQKGTDFLSILDVFNTSQENDGEKYLLILSDGGDSKEFSKEIELAKKSNIVVFILGVGTVKGAPIKLENGSFIKQHGEILVSKLNENIADLATKSGGVYIQSTTSSSDIKTMLKEIKGISKAKELKSEEIHKYIPLFYYPVAMALFLLLIATSSMSKRVRVELPSLLATIVLVFASVDSRAGVLDFMDLSEAKDAYKAEDYVKSAKLYEKYAQSSKKGESFFNAGNSLYKQKKYKEAVEAYERATFDSNSLRAKNFSNMGNALAKSQSLQKAVESYEKSLEIEEDKDTRENLEEVKKLLKKQKQQSKDSDKQNDKKDKDKDDKSESKESKEGDKDSDKKDKSKKEEDSSKSKKSEDKDQKSDDMKSKKEKASDAEDKKEKKNEKEKKEQLEKLDKDEDKNKSESQSKAQNLTEEEMSDAEEAKWIDQLNLQKNTYLYKLGEQKPMKEMSDEKPW
ncbi:protein containing tetratricopeptide repeat (TPR) domain [Sulfurimonas gotlandica GD1]|uniref:Protein containing tetratricopeptide repeat (TPR) domain n=1 Tax=Sulfurimonas gotlandica (strain DSM 19862 / JCM 16533 / GD1) TaxID=929558 RepID=B6BN41_SULGG|nr:VWA domain-containing protein [Sulfurimonas gotlandica]EDZ61610.1 von Willebrand factor, type A [Sulfurimonas gotlandica GD1]EHP30682.1 protein containing tetratricopeptide repeat (TPR) domain [Sulfurimonas gotlandica GD1]